MKSQIEEFNLFDSVVSGKYRPQLFEEDDFLNIPVSFPTLDGYIKDGKITISGLEEFLSENEPCFKGFDPAVDEVIPFAYIDKTIGKEWYTLFSELDIPPAYDDKTKFYLSFLGIAFSISMQRVRNKLSGISDPLEKCDYYSALLSSLKSLDFCSTLVDNKYTGVCNSVDATSTQYVLYATRLFIIASISAVSQMFADFCNIEHVLLSDWENSLYNEKKTDLSYLMNNISKAKDFLPPGQQHKHLSNSDLVFYYFNPRMKYFIGDYYETYVENRLNGVLTLREWIAYRDSGEDLFMGEADDLPLSGKIKISENEQIMFDEFVDILYNEMFIKVFTSTPPENKFFVAKNDLSVINAVIDGEKHDGKFISFERSYKISLTTDLSSNTGVVLRGVMSAAKGYDLLSYAPAAALIKYKGFLMSFLDEKDTAVPVKIETQPSIKKRVPKSEYLSFKYIHIDTNASALTDLKSALIKLNLIASNTSASDFKKAFSNQLPANPIVWAGGVASFYTFISILTTDLHLVETGSSSKWKIAHNLFINEDGSKFDWINLHSKKRLTNYEELLKAVKLLVE